MPTVCGRSRAQETACATAPLITPALPDRGLSLADVMKQDVYVWVHLAIVLAFLLSPSRSLAQQENDESMLQEARTAVANALGRPTSDISFEGLKLVRDNFGALVCGMVNGKRFLAGPAGKPPPQIEGTLSASMFNFLWNARCQGMSASAATEELRRELK